LILSLLDVGNGPCKEKKQISFVHKVQFMRRKDSVFLQYCEQYLILYMEIIIVLRIIENS